MTQVVPLRRLYRLPRERRRILLRALAVLTGASAAVAFLPFRNAIGFGSVSVKPRPRVTPEDCVWAVEAAAQRLPWRTMCIEKGLAVQRLLRHGGVDAVLHYGARHVGDLGKIEAHVWVSVAGTIVIGGEEAREFAEVRAFP